MRRALQLAKHGLGSSAPNPMVGAVIVHDEQIIGEGFTSAYGGAHAEVNAINSVNDKSLLKSSSMYVSLEPCSHYGKTPPCTNLIKEVGIEYVYVGCEDPNPKVSGNGMEFLRNSGIKVESGILQKECANHHKRFLTYFNKKRPYIILKWAESADGFIAPIERNEIAPVWLSNSWSRQLVHKWRAEEQAILIGSNTARLDNPTLNCRDWEGSNPHRFVINRNDDLDRNTKLFNSEATTTVLDKQILNFDLPLAQQVCEILFNNKIISIIIEGGRQTIQTFINEEIWDEARVFTSEVKLKKGIPAPRFSSQTYLERKVKTDILRIYRND